MQAIVDNRFSNTLPFEKLILDAKDDGVLRYESDMEKIKNEDSETLYNIGHSYYRRGLYYKAMTWLSLSAKNEHGEAQREIGIMHEQGLGVPVNKMTALQFYYKGSFQGSSKASNNIRHLEQQGHSLEKGEIEFFKLEHQTLANMKKKDRKIYELEEKVNVLNKLLSDEKSIVNELREKMGTPEQNNHEANSDAEEEHLADKFEVLNVTKDLDLEQRISKMESMLSDIHKTIFKESHD